MKDSAQRLYQAAKVSMNIEGQSDIARALNVAPQVVKNWEERGVSKEGILVGSRVFSCSPEWLEYGTNETTSPTFEYSPQTKEAIRIMSSMDQRGQDRALISIKYAFDFHQQYLKRLRE